ncbi:hypothetical protein EDC01DRAFT_630670 [Geopyxis carbonaria]|nr:hypothetical protein EDC01DRAFT_630670 [Geopyxis carbonaria]
MASSLPPDVERRRASMLRLVKERVRSQEPLPLVEPSQPIAAVDPTKSVHPAKTASKVQDIAGTIRDAAGQVRVVAHQTRDAAPKAPDDTTKAQDVALSSSQVDESTIFYEDLQGDNSVQVEIAIAGFVVPHINTPSPPSSTAEPSLAPQHIEYADETALSKPLVSGENAKSAGQDAVSTQDALAVDNGITDVGTVQMETWEVTPDEQYWMGKVSRLRTEARFDDNEVKLMAEEDEQDRRQLEIDCQGMNKEAKDTIIRGFYDTVISELEKHIANEASCLNEADTVSDARIERRMKDLRIFIQVAVTRYTNMILDTMKECQLPPTIVELLTNKCSEFAISPEIMSKLETMDLTDLQRVRCALLDHYGDLFTLMADVQRAMEVKQSSTSEVLDPAPIANGVGRASTLKGVRRAAQKAPIRVSELLDASLMMTETEEEQLKFQVVELEMVANLGEAEAQAFDAFCQSERHVIQANWDAHMLDLSQDLKSETHREAVRGHYRDVMETLKEIIHENLASMPSFKLNDIKDVVAGKLDFHKAEIKTRMTKLHLPIELQNKVFAAWDLERDRIEKTLFSMDNREPNSNHVGMYSDWMDQCFRQIRKNIDCYDDNDTPISSIEEVQRWVFFPVNENVSQIAEPDVSEDEFEHRRTRHMNAHLQQQNSILARDALCDVVCPAIGDQWNTRHVQEWREKAKGIATPMRNSPTRETTSLTKDSVASPQSTALHQGETAPEPGASGSAQLGNGQDREEEPNRYKWATEIFMADQDQIDKIDDPHDRVEFIFDKYYAKKSELLERRRMQHLWDTSEIILPETVIPGTISNNDDDDSNAPAHGRRRSALMAIGVAAPRKEASGSTSAVGKDVSGGGGSNNQQNEPNKNTDSVPATCSIGTEVDVLHQDASAGFTARAIYDPLRVFSNGPANQRDAAKDHERRPQSTETEEDVSQQGVSVDGSAVETVIATDSSNTERLGGSTAKLSKGQRKRLRQGLARAARRSSTTR